METTRYRALATRDARFDGRFFVGVRTTGVYCRPICPARTPRPENVRFFECAAAAECAGFRPCRRCRPETAPGSPAWLGTSATVSRALRLIADGALDEDGVEELAARVGVGGRHLRRLFARHLGASPLAIAQTRRVHFARRLLDETALPVGEIAYAAGFASVRRFHAAVRGTFGRSPSELRRAARRTAGRAGGADRTAGDGRGTGDGSLVLRLPWRAPYDADGVLAYLGARAIPGVERVADGAWWRAFRLGDRAGVVEVRPDPSGKAAVRVRVAHDLRRELLEVAERVRRVFDLGADPAAIAERLGTDPLLAPSVRRRPGLRVPGAWDPFELAVRAILGQQVSVRGATTLAGRLAAAFGEPLPVPSPDPGIDRLFPGPAALARADVASIGVPGKRADAVRELARRVAEGRLGLSWGACPIETRAQLLAIPGVGEWTASYVAMRGLGQPDELPAGDLGVRKALANGSGRLPTAREVRERAEAWRPWRAYATLHLWSGGPDGEETER